MNYIKKLQTDKEALQAQVRSLEAAVDRVRGYLCLDKFADNPMVNKQDIFLRLAEGKSEAAEAYEAVWRAREQEENERGLHG